MFYGFSGKFCKASGSSGFQPVPQQPVRTRQQHKGRRHDRRKRKDLQQIGLRKGQHQYINEILSAGGQQIIDEQRQAYKDGAYRGFYPMAQK